MKLIVGLGNPGTEYQNTRHNAGFMALDFYATKHNISFNKDKFNGLFYKGEYKDVDFILAKPQTYMNLSGDFVQAIASFYKIASKDILVVYDDMDFEVGEIAVRPKGTGGGQNGIKDIIKKVGTPEIARVRIGVGRGNEAVDHVLGAFSKADQLKLVNVFERTCKAIDEFLVKGIESAMNVANKKQA